MTMGLRKNACRSFAALLLARVCTKSTGYRLQRAENLGIILAYGFQCLASGACVPAGRVACALFLLYTGCFGSRAGKWRRNEMSERYSYNGAKRGAKASRSKDVSSSIQPSIPTSRAEYERNHVLSQEYYRASRRIDGRTQEPQHGASGQQDGYHSRQGSADRRSRQGGSAGYGGYGRSGSRYNEPGRPSSGRYAPGGGQYSLQRRRWGRCPP